MKRLLVVACVGFLAASCDVGSRQDDVGSTSSMAVPATSEANGGFGEGGEIWEGIWSTPDSTMGVNELVPRVFVVGSEVLVVFEQNQGTTVEGERYDAATGKATRIASSGLVSRANAGMVWTGDELLVVGGGSGPGIEQIGAAYTPATDSWRPLPDPPGKVDGWDNAITGPAVWTGSEMLIYRDGLAFQPAAGEWRAIPSPPGPERAFEVTVWTGDELVVWGGCDASITQCDDFASGLLTDGHTYDPATDHWERMASSPLSAGVHPQGVWTGEEVLIYAGEVSVEDAVTAAAYDPMSNSWRALPDPPLFPRRYATPAWTDQYLVLWGGSSTGSGAVVEFDDGAAYNPDTDTWLKMPETPGFDERDRHAMTWIKDRLYITGGWETTGPLIFEPATAD